MILLWIFVVDMSLEEMTKYKWVKNCNINKCNGGSIIASKFKMVSSWFNVFCLRGQLGIDKIVFHKGDILKYYKLDKF